MPKLRPPHSAFVCQSCGSHSPKWVGRCADCGTWNSLVEEKINPLKQTSEFDRYGLASGSNEASLYSEVDMVTTARIPSGIDEFDRVLGGGIVPGSVVLIGGEPGIGKSTLLLQAAGKIASAVGPVLYASGEESEHQVKDRGQRLGIVDPALYLFAETCVEKIIEQVNRLNPSLLIVDSIQTVFSSQMQAAPGSIGQVREAATCLLFLAKRKNIPIFLDGHVTKDGGLAGPKVLEHVVDTVLYFEGERHHSHRVVRAIKNRFGAVSELGVFEMTGSGLNPVANPSRLFLSDRTTNLPGSVVLSSIEGSRPILVEIQALVTSGVYGTSRRMTSGIDQQRLSLLLAVLEKRAGLNLTGEDVFVNAAGGLAIHEPAADLAVMAAVVASFRDRGIRSGTAVFGEVGLGGEVRGTPHAGLRIKEAVQLGFVRCVVPEANSAEQDLDCEVIGVTQAAQALEVMFE